MRLGRLGTLPCDDERLTYREFLALAADVAGKDLPYKIICKWALTVAGLVSKQVRELHELLPRYEQDNLFDSSKFKRRFPGLQVTTYRQGLERILNDSRS